MKFELAKWSAVHAGGFLSDFELPYKDMVKIFGKPNAGPSGDNKILVEWIMIFDDGLGASIYNWKDGKNYDPEDGLTAEELFEWHIGGIDKKVVEYITEIINNYKGQK